MAVEEEIELEVKALETCAYSNAVFTEILGKIQKAVDNLSLHSYSNLPQWVAKLDQRARIQFLEILEFLPYMYINGHKQVPHLH